MLRFCAARALDGPPEGGAWVYLGKEAPRRAALEARWGRQARPAGPLLREEFERLRQPFLDFVGSLGRGRRGDPRWWCGLVANRAQGATDLFLLVGYVGYCLRLARERAPSDPPLTVVFEDPWALRAVGEALRGRPGCAFPSPPSLLAPRARLALGGAARRLYWLALMLRGRLATLRSYRGAPPPTPPPGSVLIYSHLIARSLKGEAGWSDPFLPGLQEELEGAGARVFRLTYPDIVGLERESAARASYLRPLMLDVGPADFLRIALETPPALPRRADIGGVEAGLLLQREWWHDFSRRGRLAYLLLYEAARRHFKAARAKCLVFSWENQPQDKMLVLAAREAGLRSVGSQTTTVPRFQLPFFLGSRESDDAPLPDALLATGTHAVSALSAGGIPSAVLRDGGTRRYAAYLADKPLPPRPPSPDVLLLLPIDRHLAWMMLDAVAAAYPDAGQGFRFHLRLHPSEPIDASRVPFPFEKADGPMDEALDRCGVMLFAGSTAGLDGLLGGRRVLRYRPDAVYDMDPCDMFDETLVPSTDGPGLRAALEALRGRPLDALPPGTRERLARVFSPVAPSVWRDAVLKS